MLEPIFNEVYYKFTEGDYKVCLSTDRNTIINETPPPMESTEALQATVNYIIWEWSHDHKDQRFKSLIETIYLPPTDYDLSIYSFKELLQVVSPELIKTSNISEETDKTTTSTPKKKPEIKKKLIKKEPQQSLSLEEELSNLSKDFEDFI